MPHYLNRCWSCDLYYTTLLLSGFFIFVKGGYYFDLYSFGSKHKGLGLRIILLTTVGLGNIVHIDIKAVLPCMSGLP